MSYHESSRDDEPLVYSWVGEYLDEEDKEPASATRYDMYYNRYDRSPQWPDKTSARETYSDYSESSLNNNFMHASKHSLMSNYEYAKYRNNDYDEPNRFPSGYSDEHSTQQNESNFNEYDRSYSANSRFCSRSPSPHSAYLGNSNERDSCQRIGSPNFGAHRGLQNETNYVTSNKNTASQSLYEQYLKKGSHNFLSSQNQSYKTSRHSPDDPQDRYSPNLSPRSLSPAPRDSNGLRSYDINDYENRLYEEDQYTRDARSPQYTNSAKDGYLPTRQRQQTPEIEHNDVDIFKDDVRQGYQSKSRKQSISREISYDNEHDKGIGNSEKGLYSYRDYRALPKQDLFELHKKLRSRHNSTQDKARVSAPSLEAYSPMAYNDKRVVMSKHNSSNFRTLSSLRAELLGKRSLDNKAWDNKYRVVVPRDDFPALLEAERALTDHYNINWITEYVNWFERKILPFLLLSSKKVPSRDALDFLMCVSQGDEWTSPYIPELNKGGKELLEFVDKYNSAILQQTDSDIGRNVDYSTEAPGVLSQKVDNNNISANATSGTLKSIRHDIKLTRKFSTKQEDSIKVKIQSKRKFVPAFPNDVQPIPKKPNVKVTTIVAVAPKRNEVATTGVTEGLTANHSNTNLQKEASINIPILKMEKKMIVSRSRSRSRSSRHRSLSSSSESHRHKRRRTSITKKHRGHSQSSPRRHRSQKSLSSSRRRRSRSACRRSPSTTSCMSSPSGRRSPSTPRGKLPTQPGYRSMSILRNIISSSPRRRRRSLSPPRRKRSPSPHRRKRSPSRIRHRRSPSPPRHKRSASPYVSDRRRRNRTPLRFTKHSRSRSPVRRRGLSRSSSDSKDSASNSDILIADLFKKHNTNTASNIVLNSNNPGTVMPQPYKRFGLLPPIAPRSYACVEAPAYTATQILQLLPLLQYHVEKAVKAGLNCLYKFENYTQAKINHIANIAAMNYSILHKDNIWFTRTDVCYVIKQVLDNPDKQLQSEHTAIIKNEHREIANIVQNNLQTFLNYQKTVFRFCRHKLRPSSRIQYHVSKPNQLATKGIAVDLLQVENLADLTYPVYCGIAPVLIKLWNWTELILKNYRRYCSDHQNFKFDPSGYEKDNLDIYMNNIFRSPPYELGVSQSFESVRKIKSILGGQKSPHLEDILKRIIKWWCSGYYHLKQMNDMGKMTKIELLKQEVDENLVVLDEVHSEDDDIHKRVKIERDATPPPPGTE